MRRRIPPAGSAPAGSQADRAERSSPHLTNARLIVGDLGTARVEPPRMGERPPSLSAVSRLREAEPKSPVVRILGDGLAKRALRLGVSSQGKLRLRAQTPRLRRPWRPAHGRAGLPFRLAPVACVGGVV